MPVCSKQDRLLFFTLFTQIMGVFGFNPSPNESVSVIKAYKCINLSPKSMEVLCPK